MVAGDRRPSVCVRGRQLRGWLTDGHGCRPRAVRLPSLVDATPESVSSSRSRTSWAAGSTTCSRGSRSRTDESSASGGNMRVHLQTIQRLTLHQSAGTTERHARSAAGPVLVVPLEHSRNTSRNDDQNMRTHIFLFGRVQIRSLSPRLSPIPDPPKRAGNGL